MGYDIERVLTLLDPAGLDYGDWLHVGMALKNEGRDFSVWDEWSSKDRGTRSDGGPRYEGTAALKIKWDGFSSSPAGVLTGTVVDIAKRCGVDLSLLRPVPGGPSHEPPARYGDPPKGPSPGGLSPAAQLKKYMTTLFDPADIVGYVTESARPREGRWSPDRGTYTRTAGEIVRILEDTGDVAKAVGRWHDECGAWMRINTFDGEGVTDRNVRTFRFALVESDTATKEQQAEIYRRLRLPVACLVDSGGKSVHAVVRVDAKTPDEYRDRVNFLYGFVESEGGLKVDHNNRNPSRLSRMPGVTRNGQTQTLLGCDLGFKCFDEWKYFADTGLERPALVCPLNFPERPQRVPELIKGVLRFGQKMFVSGPSKAAKSFFLIELGICISQGKSFLGFETARGKVLYLNMEIDEASCNDRVFCVGRAMGVSSDPEGGFMVRNMRGEAKPAGDVVTEIIRDYRDAGFKCVILDPIYKVMPGDENSAEDMTRLTNELDRLCNALGCSVIYAHHHSKGAQGSKSPLDRASGSGVLARDADAILDLTEVEVDSSVTEKARLPSDVTVWEMEIVTRDFRKQNPRRVYFDYPLHKVDSEGIFSGCRQRGAVRPCREKAKDAAAGKSERERELLEAFDKLGVSEAKAADLAKIMAGDPEKLDYQTLYSTKRRLVYAVCEESDRFEKGDGTIKKLR